MIIKDKLKQIFTLLLATIAPFIAMAQDPPAPSDGGGEPVDVPLGDTTTNILFLALGIFFVGMILFRSRSRHKAMV